MLKYCLSLLAVFSFMTTSFAIQADPNGTIGGRDDKYTLEVKARDFDFASFIETLPEETAVVGCSELNNLFAIIPRELVHKILKTNL